MTAQEAVSILMLSPVYFRLDIAQRKQLVKEYRTLYRQIHRREFQHRRRS